MKNKLSDMTRSLTLLRRIQPIAVWLLAAVLIGLGGCEKEKFLQEAEGIENRIIQIKKQLSPLEADFFNPYYVAQNHPDIHPGELIQFRDGEDEAFVNSVVEKLMLDNATHHFVTGMISNAGYPVWSRSMILREETQAVRLAVIPFVKMNESITSSYLLAMKPDDEWMFAFVDRVAFKYFLQHEAPTAERARKTFFAINFMWLDKYLFGKEDLMIKQWVRQHGQAPLRPDSETIEYRCTQLIIINGTCLIFAISSDNNTVESRQDCVSQIWSVQGAEIVSIGCGPPGTSFGGSSGGGVQWTGGPLGTTGSGAFGGWGSGPSAFNHPYLSPILSRCSQVGQAADGENASGITYTAEELAGCNALSSVIGGIIITPDHLAWLHQNRPEVIASIAAYLTNGGGVSNIERQGLAAYAALLASGRINIPLRQFMPRYQLVYGQLVPALGLSQDEALYLLLDADSALASQIQQFLQEHGYSYDSQTAASFVFRSIHQDVYNGPYNGTFQDILNQYSEYNNDPLFGLKVAIEAATLKLHHPDWSNFRIGATALLNISLEQTHLQLDFLGLIPGAGEIADLANGAIYTLEGDWFNAGLSFSASIPVTGWVSTGVKFANKVHTGVSQSKFVLKYIVDPASGLIKFGDRGQLNRVLRTPSGQQAHHIVPWGKTDHSVIQKAASAGSNSAFHPNEVFNGVNLPTTRHQGSHGSYDDRITQRLNEWAIQNHSATPEQAAKSIKQWLQTLKNQIENSTAHIKDIVPPVIPFVP